MILLTITQIGIYTINQFNELWYIYCDKIYLKNKQVMETIIKRWKEVNDELITHSLLHQYANVSIPDNLSYQFYLQSFIQLNRGVIYNLVVKCDLNSNIVSNCLKFDLNSKVIAINLYIYQTHYSISF